MRKTVSSHFFNIRTKIECPAHTVEHSDTFLNKAWALPVPKMPFQMSAFHNGRMHKTETFFSKNPKDRLHMMLLENPKNEATKNH